MHPLNVSLAHLSHPIGVTAENPGAQVALKGGPRVAEHVQRGSKKHVDADRREFFTHNLPDGLGIGLVPGRAQGHVVG